MLVWYIYIYMHKVKLMLLMFWYEPQCIEYLYNDILTVCYVYTNIDLVYRWYQQCNIICRKYFYTVSHNIISNTYFHIFYSEEYRCPARFLYQTIQSYVCVCIYVSFWQIKFSMFWKISICIMDETIFVCLCMDDICTCCIYTYTYIYMK